VLFATYYLRAHRTHLAVVVRIAPCVVPNTVWFSNRQIYLVVLLTLYSTEVP